MFRIRMSSTSTFALLLFLWAMVGAAHAETTDTVVLDQNWELGIDSWYASNGVWEVGTPCPGVGPGAAHSLPNCAATVLCSNYPAYASTRLVSPQIVLPGISGGEEIWMSYWQWFAIHMGGDGGHVQVSTDNGINWTNVSEPPFAYYWGTVWSPTGLDLSTYAGQTIRLGFQFTSGDAYEDTGWYIDDVLVSVRNKPYWSPGVVEGFENGYGNWYVDHGVWEVGPYDDSHSGQNCAGTVLNGSYPVYASTRLISPRISLPSISAGQEIWLSYWQWFAIHMGGDGGHVQVSTDNGINWTNVSEPPFAYYWGTVWSPTGLDLSTYAGQTIRLGFQFTSGDAYEDTGWYIDDVLVSVRNKPYWSPGVVEGFENGYGNWYVDHGVWEVGPYDDSHSGQNCAGTVLNGSYPVYASTRLISPRISLPSISAGQEIWLSYWQWFAIHMGGDGGHVQVSTDNGINWTNVSEPPFAYYWGTVWSPTGLDLSTYAGQTIRLGFQFTSGDAYEDTGWYIDDVLVSVRNKPYWSPGVVEGFENGYGNWYVDHGVWEVGPYDDSHSGQNCAGTVLNGSYPVYASTRLISPRISLPSISAGQEIWLSYWQWFAIHMGGDGGHVQVSTDNGINWTNVSEPPFAYYWGTVWSPTGLDLSTYAGQTIRLGFQFTSGDAYEDTGWYIDDVLVSVRPKPYWIPGVVEGFENGYGDWYVDKGVWEIGPYASSHSGQNCAGTVLAGNYPPYASTHLISPWIRLCGSSPGMFFWHKFSISGGDYGRVEVTTNGKTWRQLANGGGPYSGTSPWTQAFADLSAYADSTIQIGFYLYSNPSSQSSGWYIDDIRIEGIVPPPGVDFVRSDVDGSGEVNISDPIYNLAYQFANGPLPTCLHTADDDDSGEINISDPIYSLAYQFAGGPPPAAPFPSCGPDPTSDCLACQSFPNCEGAPAGPETAVRLTGGSEKVKLGPPQDAPGDTVTIPIHIETGAALLGFEFSVSFEPARLEFLGLQKRVDLDFFSAHAEKGRVRVGGVVDFQMQSPLASGQHDLGELRFVLRPEGSAQESPLRVSDAHFVATDLGTIMAKGESTVLGDQAIADLISSAGVGPDRLSFANPYRMNESILLQCGTPREIELVIYNVHGQRVRTLLHGPVAAGQMDLRWNGRTDGNLESGTGIYYLRAVIGTEQIHRKFLFLR